MTVRLLQHALIFVELMWNFSPGWRLLKEPLDYSFREKGSAHWKKKDKEWVFSRLFRVLIQKKTEYGTLEKSSGRKEKVIQLYHER